MTQVSIQLVLDAAIQHHQAGRLAEAEIIYRKILSQQPNHADALHLLGVLATQAGQNQLAVELIGKAIASNKKSPVYYNNLGSALLFLGQLDKAAAAFREALQLKPDYAQAYTNLGNVLKDRGQVDAAIDCYRKALKFKPDLIEAHNNLGNALQAQGDSIAAAAAYKMALKLKPDYADAYNNLGVALVGLGQVDAGIAAYRDALRLKPNYPEAYNNLGNALKDQGRIHEAVAAFQTCIQIRPDLAQVHSNLVYNTYFHPDYDTRAIYNQMRIWNQQHAEPLKRFLQPHSHDRNPERRLKIGYVSPDFFSHSESFFTLPLLEAHNHQDFEIHCYASVSLPDHMTDRIRRSADVWHNVLGKTHSELAEQIRSDQIDILIDLTMHMANNRLLVFARKPAPIQVAWLAYPGSTGLEAIDYRLTDSYLDPPGDGAPYSTEEAVRLPDCWCCYDPLIDESREPAPGINDLPAIKNGYVTFGSLNNFCKVNDGVLKLWAKVLTAVPHSRLLVLAPQGQVRQQVLGKLGRDVVAPERIEFADFRPRQEYLKLYHRIDLGLDTQPYNGITTTLDALWMGVPVISMAGNTAASRAGLGILSTLGMPELTAQTPEQFVQIASALAGDLPRLAELRKTLRVRMQASPLMDAKRFARNVEAAYRDMWRKWCEKSVNDAL